MHIFFWPQEIMAQWLMLACNSPLILHTNASSHQFYANYFCTESQHPFYIGNLLACQLNFLAQSLHFKILLYTCGF